MIRSRKSPIYRSGFTLVELVVSIAIFAIMTALVVAKYGNFNNSLLLTNLAYDVAGTIRTAQTYGLSVRSTDTGVLPPAYGVFFNYLTSGASGLCKSVDSARFYLFADTGTEDYECGTGDSVINEYLLKNGTKISGLCIGSSSSACNTTPNYLSISFKRPNPDALIMTGAADYGYARITLQSASGDTRMVSVYKNGQISVGD
jgi:prepilin-type N-terminal cleavage/methylation domain-containing protein